MTGAGTHPARIEFRDWGWRYAGRDAWAVRGLDLLVEPGERVAVVGASGAGKSTLLRAVAAVLSDEPDPDDETAATVQGTVLVDGAAPGTVRGRVGLVMQDPEAHTVMSRVGDDVAFGCENLGVPRAETWARVRAALDVVGLDLPLDRSTTMLSGGQRQRLALAGVLAMRPGGLVLDEPCANLDPDGVRQVHDAVRSLLDDTGATMLVVEHRIGTWLDLVDRLVLLAPGGGVLADGSPARVLGEHAASLTAAGVWVPGADPARGSARSPDAVREPVGRQDLLVAAGLGTARGKRQPVGSGIDLTVRAGEVLAVTGPNGVGKSTLGLTLAGLLRPADGTLRATDALTTTNGAATTTVAATTTTATPARDRRPRRPRRPPPRRPRRPAPPRTHGPAASSPPASARSSRTRSTSSSHAPSVRNSPPARSPSAPTPTRSRPASTTSSRRSASPTWRTRTPSRCPGESSAGWRSAPSRPRVRRSSCSTNRPPGRTEPRGRPSSDGSVPSRTPGPPSSPSRTTGTSSVRSTPARSSSPPPA